MKTPTLRVKATTEVNQDFKTQVVVNNNLTSVTADTGARVSVCGTKEAKKWGLLERIVPSRIKIKPYNSTPIPVFGVSRCAVTFGMRSVPVLWHIIEGSCELGILKFNG